MFSRDETVLINAETLQALAKKLGKHRLLKEMDDSGGVTLWTANEMLKGKYQKALRIPTQKALFECLNKYGATREKLFKRAVTREKRPA